MEELEGVHETLNACGLVLRWGVLLPPIPGRLGFGSAEWRMQTGASATLLRGWRAGPGIPWAGWSPLLLFSVLLSFDPGAQNEDLRDLRRRMRSSWWLGHAGISPRPLHLVLLPIHCGWHYLLFQAIGRGRLHSKLHRSPPKPNMPCANCEARSWLPCSWLSEPVDWYCFWLWLCWAETWGSEVSGDCVHISASPLSLCDIQQLV